MRYVLNGPLREYIDERHMDETKTKLTETFLITPASIHTNMTTYQIRCNRTYVSFEAIILKLIFRYYKYPGCRLVSSNVTRDGCYFTSYRR